MYMGIAVSPDGKVYIIDDGTCTVKVFGQNGKTDDAGAKGK